MRETRQTNELKREYLYLYIVWLLESELPSGRSLAHIPLTLELLRAHVRRTYR